MPQDGLMRMRTNLGQRPKGYLKAPPTTFTDATDRQCSLQAVSWVPLLMRVLSGLFFLLRLVKPYSLSKAYLLCKSSSSLPRGGTVHITLPLSCWV